MIDLTDKQKEILNADGHVLVKGGPGSGKTTVAILKAGIIVRERLQHSQRVLFLSFARATVSRVLEAIDEAGELAHDVKRQIEVDTYHAFFLASYQVARLPPRFAAPPQSPDATQ